MQRSKLLLWYNLYLLRVRNVHDFNGEFLRIGMRVIYLHQLQILHVRHLPLGLVGTVALVLLEDGVGSFPVALEVGAARLQVIDDLQRDQVFLQFAALYAVLAERTLLLEQRPVLDADVAEGVAG